MIKQPPDKKDLSDSPMTFVVRTFILKVASRCNLNCDYCYMYNKGDLSYIRQPKRMSSLVSSAMLNRVQKYCTDHGMQEVEFVFHGGEPLLAGKRFFREFVCEAKRLLSPAVTPIFNMQTNGTLLDQDWLDLLIELKIGFGISLDGPKEINDSHRVDH